MNNTPEHLELYHGSSSVFIERIASEGLMPSTETGIKAFDHIQKNADKIHLTTSLSFAQIMAEVGVIKKYGGNVIVVEVSVSRDEVECHPFIVGEFFHSGPLKAIKQISEFRAIPGPRFPSYQLIDIHHVFPRI